MDMLWPIAEQSDFRYGETRLNGIDGQFTMHVHVCHCYCTSVN